MLLTVIRFIEQQTMFKPLFPIQKKTPRYRGIFISIGYLSPVA